jgi:hypothetical protein
VYDAPFDALTRLGWGLAAAVVVALAARAVRVEQRRVHVDARSRPVRVADAGLDVVCALVVVAFVVLLGVIVAAVFG